MGVKGLHSYIESNSDFLKTRWFRESKLIIDGSSLYYSLYLRSHIDQAHGGDYSGFDKTVTQFFRNLRMCDIQPYVVIDGGDDVSGIKFHTLKTRCQERIRRANRLSKGGSGEIIPILMKNVFKQILRKLGVPFIQCLAEADWETAALANEWNCPVLSNDSDFYIFSNRGGYLPIDHFQWRKVSHKSTAKKFIISKWFGFKNLCSAFNRMNKQLLPLFAIILGNDYTKLDKSALPNFSKFSTRPGGTAQIDGLLMWLSRFPNPKEAINALLSPLGNQRSENLNTAINHGMAAYQLNPSSIAQFFISGEPQGRSPGPLENLPDWSLKPLAEGKLASTVIEVLTLQRVMLNFQVEDFGLSSSSETSRPIRQVMYGVLLCTRRQKVGKRSRSSGEELEHSVEEFDRTGTMLTSSMVPAVLPQCVATNLHLDSLWEEPQHLRLQVVLEALGVSSIAASLQVPEGLQLAVYVTCYWIKHATPKPRAEMFWALLTGLVFGHLSRELQAEQELQPVMARFKKLQSRKGKKCVDLELAHAYSQWQSCLKDSYTLNQLLNHPVPEPELAWLYCGTLVHGAAHELKRGIEPESFLAGAPVAIALYRNLQAAVEHELDDDFIKKMRTRTWITEVPVDELSKTFTRLMDEDEDEPQSMMDDKALEETCSVRVRHKTKCRNTKSRSTKQDQGKFQ
ncbi:protein asteroid-like 1 [Silurus meridionalis]|nr:protein asteroid-like 1 [Silurus meridionalis]